MIETEVAIENPFPGLPRFEPHQAKYFYGRSNQIQQMLRHLDAHRFLAVIGSSGCGKSSLVRAGLLPALFRGYLGSGPNWRVALMTPGTQPCEALAQALSDPKCFAIESVPVETALRESTLGLLKVARANLAPQQNLLVVVDQFEEIFRFRQKSDSADKEAAHFVDLLLQATTRSDDELRVVLTMRTDYLTDCAQFDGLPEIMNKAQFLVPRLTREERQEAIQRPLDFIGVEYAPRLVQRVLNDAGDDPTNLPVLQHALRRTFEHWLTTGSSGPIDIADYEAATANGSAIEKHAEAVYANLSPDEQLAAEKVFRTLTNLDRGRKVRRPSTIENIQAITECGKAASSVVGRFAEEAFLTINQDGAVDLTHESVIERWPRLNSWVDEEQRSADWYRQIVDSVRFGRSFWKGAELRAVERLRRKDGWNQAWAEQYAPEFANAMQFLRRSRARRLRIGIYSIVLIVLVSVATFWIINRLNSSKARAEVSEAKAAALEAKVGEQQAIAARFKAQADELFERAKSAPQAEKAALLAQAEQQQKLAETYTQQVEKLKSTISAKEAADLATIASLRDNLDSATKDRDKYKSELERQTSAMNAAQDKARSERQKDLPEQGLSSIVDENGQPRLSCSVQYHPDQVEIYGKSVTRQYFVVMLHLQNTSSTSIVVEQLSLKIDQRLWNSDNQGALEILAINDKSAYYPELKEQFVLSPNQKATKSLFFSRSAYAPELSRIHDQLPEGAQIVVSLRAASASRVFSIPVPEWHYSP